MADDLSRIRAKLIDRWASIPDYPPATDVDELCRRSYGLLQLIYWIDSNPNETMDAYRKELAKVKQTTGQQ